MWHLPSWLSWHLATLVKTSLGISLPPLRPEVAFRSTFLQEVLAKALSSSALYVQILQLLRSVVPPFENAKLVNITPISMVYR